MSHYFLHPVSILKGQAQNSPAGFFVLSVRPSSWLLNRPLTNPSSVARIYVSDQFPSLFLRAHALARGWLHLSQTNYFLNLPAGSNIEEWLPQQKGIPDKTLEPALVHLEERCPFVVHVFGGKWSHLIITQMCFNDYRTHTSLTGLSIYGMRSPASQSVNGSSASEQISAPSHYMLILTQAGKSGSRLSAKSYSRART